MHLFGIKPPRRRIKKKYLTNSVFNHSYTNLIRDFTPTLPKQIYASDFTYVKYQNRHIYLSTIQDIFTKEIVSSNISLRHNSEAILETIKQGLKYGNPHIFHSDQGSEFMSTLVTSFLEQNNINISVSDKGSPWQNGYKESFYDKFKTEVGNINRFDTLEEAVVEIYSYIKYYNTLRIHTSIDMSPLQFKQQLQDGDSMSKKTGT